ncbi:MAG: hypothetical protein NTY35_07750 [Planctomycetota bacterium]|nr:hypothetical protein [Planctomycetota bacterium]
METPLPDVLAEIEAWIARGKPPTRLQARGLLLGLGDALLEGRSGDETEAFARVAGWIERAPDPWREAFSSEISMAATEHVRSVDPRWLGNPKYDLPYTVEARHRLESRLACAEHLGIEVPEELLEAIARADALLAPYLEGGSAASGSG